MERKGRLNDIIEQVQELKEDFAELGKRFLEEGEKLISPGRLPNNDLLNETTTYTQKFNTVLGDLRELARDLSWDGFPGEMNSISSISEVCDGLSVHLEEIYRLEKQERETRQARDILTRALGVTSSFENLMAEIEAFREKMHASQEILSRPLNDQEATRLRDQLVTGEHPAVCLIRLAENHMDLKSTADLFQAVAEEYGILLTIAAMKKYLRFPEQKHDYTRGQGNLDVDKLAIETDQENELSVMPRDVDPGAENGAEEMETYESISSHDKVSIGIEQEEQNEEEEDEEAAERELMETVEEDLADSKNVNLFNTKNGLPTEEQENRAEQQKANLLSYTHEPQKTRQEFERDIIDESMKQQQKEMERIIFNLLQENYLGPAYWLSCYYEEMFVKAPSVPAHLIRALEFSRIVKGDGGPASHWLSYLYRQSEFQLLVTENPVNAKDLGLNIMVFTSLMKPVLVAPGTLAPALLEQMAGLPVSLERFAIYLGEWGDEKSVYERNSKDLSKELLEWHRRTEDQGLVSSPQVVKIWEEMQQEGGALHTLLQPILNEETQLSDEFLKLVQNLKNEKNIQDYITYLYRSMQYLVGPLDFFEIPDSWQLLSRFREAVKLAERWKQQVRSGQIDTEEQSLAMQTKSFSNSSFGELLASAREELHQIVDDNPGEQLIDIAIFLFEKAMEDLEELLKEGKPAVMLAEKIYTLELSNNQQLSIQPPWKPSSDSIKKLGKTLLRLIQDGNLSDASVVSMNFLEDDDNMTPIHGNTNKKETKKMDDSFSIEERYGPGKRESEDTEESPFGAEEDYLDKNGSRKQSNVKNKGTFGRFSVFSKRQD